MIQTIKRPLSESFAQIHYSDADFEYHLSWIPHPDRTFNWPQSRKYCRALGMEGVSMESAAKWKLVKDVFATGINTD